jgi:membrane-associated protein
MEIIKHFIDLFLHLDKHLTEIVHNYGTLTYLILFLIIFTETGVVILPFLPGDSLLFAAGALAALPESNLNVYLLGGLLIVAAFLGDTLNYSIGKYFGLKLFSMNLPFLKQEHLDKTQTFYDKHGGKTIIYARFIPIIRTFAPFVAGIGKMNYGKFISFNFFGGLAWVILFLAAGFMFGNIEAVRKNFTLVILAIIVLSITPPIIEYVKSKMAKPQA